MNKVPEHLEQNALLDEVGAGSPFGSYYNPKDGIGQFFAPIPDWLQPRREISPGAKIFFGLLIQLCPKDKGQTKGSQRDLAKRLGVSDRAIRKWNNELEGVRLIEIIRVGKQQNNIYRFLLHPWMQNK